jgi:hypothetical protein
MAKLSKGNALPRDCATTEGRVVLRSEFFGGNLFRDNGHGYGAMAGTIRLIGSKADTIFSPEGSSIRQDAANFPENQVNPALAAQPPSPYVL